MRMRKTIAAMVAVLLFSLLPQQHAYTEGIRDAAKNGDLVAVKQAIASGDDKDSQSAAPFFTIGSSGFSKDGEMSYSPDAEWTPLIHAAFAGHAPVVQYLLEIGGDPNLRDFSGLTAFMYAISKKHTSVVAALAGNQNALNFKEPTFGMTPLMWAIVMREDAIVGEILKARPDLAAADNDGWTALHYAARSGRANALDLLLEKGAEVNAVDGAGKTCLMMAAETGNAEAVASLLESRVDRAAKSKEGKTAMDYANSKLGLRALKIENIGKDAIRISEGFDYQRDIVLRSPSVIRIKSIDRGIMSTEGMIPMGAESAVGITWVFTKPGLILHNGDYTYTSLTNGSTIEFTKEGANLKGFKIENPNEDAMRKVIKLLNK